MKPTLIGLVVLGIVVGVVGAVPQKRQASEDVAAKIFSFLDKSTTGRVPVASARAELQKILPLGDDEKLDVDGDGAVSLSEFRAFYDLQYAEWKRTNLGPQQK